jgi:phage shock protein A
MAEYKDLTRQLMIEIESLEEEIRRVHSEYKNLDKLIETMENDKAGLYSIDNKGLKTLKSARTELALCILRMDIKQKKLKSQMLEVVKEELEEVNQRIKETKTTVSKRTIGQYHSNLDVSWHDELKELDI